MSYEPEEMDFSPKRSYFKKGDRVKADLSAYLDLGSMRPYGTITGENSGKGLYEVCLDYPVRGEVGDQGNEAWLLEEYELDHLQPSEEAERLQGAARLAGPSDRPGAADQDYALARELHQSVISHPAHYVSHPSGIEPIEITKHETFLRGNILKYVLRAPYKGNELQDLLKARQYLAWEIERVEEETQ